MTMEKTVYTERNRRDIINCYGDVTGFEYDVYFDENFIGVIDNNFSFGPYGSSTGKFQSCETTSPLTEVAEKMGVELIYPDGKPVQKYW